MPLVEEFLQALATELQKVRNIVHGSHGRGPPEIVERPALVFAGLYRQGRRHDAAYVAVELQRASLDQTPQPGREVRGPQESTGYISRVRRAREQSVRWLRLPCIWRDLQLLAPAVPVFLVVEQVRKLVAVRPALAKRLAGEDERPQMLWIVVVVEREALRGNFVRRGPLPEHRNLRASGVPPNTRKSAERAFPHRSAPHVTCRPVRTDGILSLQTGHRGVAASRRAFSRRRFASRCRGDLRLATGSLQTGVTHWGTSSARVHGDYSA